LQVLEGGILATHLVVEIRIRTGKSLGVWEKATALETTEFNLTG